ncbi:hypothetical protein [Parasitella parasitica]|uniref:PiggyBac transposable element-derived protein domain-containing protein n=1 Tax=Parasitella parasitica TaxID=35722 RepID=A0A0B7NBT5_9FUNG|nr:hypothetical protein [Parasitella parasitica]
MSNDAAGKVMCNGRLNALPDHTFVFPRTILKFQGGNSAQRGSNVPKPPTREEEGSSTLGFEDEEEAEAEMIDMTAAWIKSQVTVDTFVPGKYLCIDKSMNQWLGSGMPNVKKVPKKPHPIGQQFKTLADNHTYCILQLDTISDKFPSEFDNENRNLAEQIIADSLFGSPEMTTKLLEQGGLYSVMQVTKRAYWPRGMPAGECDVMRCLGPERGSFVSSFTQRDEYASSCSTTTLCTRQGDRGAPPRPQVFDEYEVNKSSGDANNNSRHNMISFQDFFS